MCLRINDKIPNRNVFNIDRETIATVYKKVWHDPEHPRKNWYTSSMHYHSWVDGKNVSDRKSVELTPEEIEKGVVEKGFHFYIKPPSNEVLPPEFSGELKIIEVEVAEDDIVAVGRYGGELCLVATKAFFKLPSSLP